MSSKIKDLLQDSLNIKICQSFIIICFIYLAIIVWKWRTLPPELPLYYSFPRGAEQLGSPVEFLLLPLLTIAIFVVHFILAVSIYDWEKVGAKLLLISALVTSFALLFTFIRIVILIT